MSGRTFSILMAAGAMAVASSLAAKEIHVAVTGDDGNSGDVASPFQTIQRAADAAEPGDVVTVHAGFYREQVDPQRGGQSDSTRIVYQAAPGDKVVITGADAFDDWTPMENGVWKADMANWFFGDFNPYGDLIQKGGEKGEQHTGAVFVNGNPLVEVAGQLGVNKAKGRLCWGGKVTEARTGIWARFGGKDPNQEKVEIGVRQTVFYPSKTNVNFITIRGFIMRDAATPWASSTGAQIGLVGTHNGTGWIIESNTISYSKACGITLGTETNSGQAAPDVVRYNDISQCGQSAIFGAGPASSVISDNKIHDVAEGTPSQ